MSIHSSYKDFKIAIGLIGVGILSHLLSTVTPEEYSKELNLSGGYSITGGLICLLILLLKIAYLIYKKMKS